MLEWIKNNGIELFGTATGLLYIYLEINEKIWLWLIGIISCSVYIYVFFVSKFYADMGLQVYYVAISFYGWYNWRKGNVKTKKKELPISRIPVKQIVYSTLATFVFFIIIGLILDYLTDSQLPYWDSFTTSLGITGTWMLAKKYIEQWYLWIVADIVSTSLYLYKHLYPTAFLYLVFTIMAFVGLYEWRKHLKLQQTKQIEI